MIEQMMTLLVKDAMNSQTKLSRLLAQSAEVHSHLCPRQVLGVRMGLAGMERVGLEAPMTDKEALVFIEMDGCFATGIEVATGAAVGHRTLKVVDMGKVAATFVNVASGLAVRLAARGDLRERAAGYAQGCTQKYAAQLQAYQVMPEEEMFTFRKVRLTPSIEAILSKPGVRTACEECGEEIINEREVRVEGKVVCRTCAGFGYYTGKDPVK